jgi:hypothetical protein
VTLALALLAALGWCLLLFGIGLDDLTNGHTKPGVIFSLAALVAFIGALLYVIWRAVRPAVRRFARR